MRLSRRVLRNQQGLTILEVMIAAVLILIIFFGLSMVYKRGRTQTDHEEMRRKATAVGQERLDWLRRDFRYDDLPALDGVDTTFVVDGRSFVVSHSITPSQPESLATTVAVTVSFPAQVADSTILRTLTNTTILGRGMP